jgi:hypothetical protein
MTHTMVGLAGEITTVSEDLASPGTRTTARWHNHEAEVRGRETSRLEALESFITPDGSLWNSSFGALHRFVGRSWEALAALAWPLSANGRPLEVGFGLRAVNESGPPWVLLDSDREQLLRLSYGPSMTDVRLDAVSSDHWGGPIKVRDAISWSKDRLLLATDRGLRTLTVSTSELASPPIDVGGRAVARLCRDTLGRLWIGGEGLTLIDVEHKVIHPLDALPAAGRCAVEAIAADPGRPGGIIAAIEGRGVVFVQVSGTTPAERERR